MKIINHILLIYLAFTLVSCGDSNWIEIKDSDNSFYSSPSNLLYPKLGDTVRGNIITFKFILLNDSNNVYNRDTIKKITFSDSPYFDNHVKSIYTNLALKEFNKQDTITYKLPVDSLFSSDIYFWKYNINDNDYYYGYKLITERMYFYYEK